MERKVKVGTIQFTRKFGDKQENIESARGFIEEAASQGAKIISLPEFFSTGYFPVPGNEKMNNDYFKWAESIPGPTTDQIEKIAKSLDIYVIAPIYEIDKYTRVYYDSAPIVGPSGVIGLFRKRHIPSLPRLVEKYYYAPGNIQYPVFETQYCRIGISICYDRHFPETFRHLALKGAEVVFSVNNTPTPRSLKMWFAEIEVAANSNGIYIVQNNTVGEELGFFGKSFITGPRGDTLFKLEEEQGVLVAELDLGEIEDARLHYKSLWDTNWEDFGLKNSHSGYINLKKS
jgi:N-carbamoylputrescine amidase